MHKNVVSVLHALRFVIYDHCKQLITLHIRSITIKHLATTRRGQGATGSYYRIVLLVVSVSTFIVSFVHRHYYSSIRSLISPRVDV